MSSDAPAPADGVRITWLGTAGCFITDGQTAFFIDPFVSRPGLLKVALGVSLSPLKDLIGHWCQKTCGASADAVIVSHSHYDHAMDAPFFAADTGAVLMGSQSTAWIGRGAGMAEDRIRIVAADDRIRLGRFDIKFLESRHGAALFGSVPWPGQLDKPLIPPAAASRYRLGETFTLVIEHPAGTLVHNGSAGYLPGMFDGIRADVVLLGIAGRKNSRSLIENIVLPLKARVLIPIHFDHFFSPLPGPEESIRSLWGVGLKEFTRSAAAYADIFGVRWIPIGKPVAVF